MDDIVNYKHTFEIEGHSVELTINRINGYWTSDITKGYTGTGMSCGGEWESLEDYIKDHERDHRYSFNFFNLGQKDG